MRGRVDQVDHVDRPLMPQAAVRLVSATMPSSAPLRDFGFGFWNVWGRHLGSRASTRAILLSAIVGAIEEPRPDCMKINLRYYAPPNCEGSHYWKLTIADDEAERGLLLINYCPFCGGPIRVADSP